MALFSRKPDLPAEHHAAWWAFVDSGMVIEAGRRVLLGTLPTGRVEPAPIAVGADAIERAVADAREMLPAWRVEELVEDWADCERGLDEAAGAIPQLRQIAADTGELEELLTATTEVVAPLDAYADAERAWRRRWRVPADNERPPPA